MKRNLELYRRILVAVEHSPSARCDLRSLPDIDEPEFAYHTKLLSQAGLLEAIDASSFDGECWIATSLTHQGHEFLDALKEEGIWHSAKETSKRLAGTITLETLKLSVPLVLKSLIT